MVRIVVGLLKKETMKDYGFVARWGGEEFLFVFREMNGDEAVVILNRLREKIGKMVRQMLEGKGAVRRTLAAYIE